MTQFDPLYNLPDNDPAQFIAVDGDLLDIELVVDAPETVELDEAVLA